MATSSSSRFVTWSKVTTIRIRALAGADEAVVADVGVVEMSNAKKQPTRTRLAQPHAVQPNPAKVTSRRSNPRAVRVVDAHEDAAEVVAVETGTAQMHRVTNLEKSQRFRTRLIRTTAHDLTGTHAPMAIRGLTVTRDLKVEVVLAEVVEEDEGAGAIGTGKKQKSRLKITRAMISPTSAGIRMAARKRLPPFHAVRPITRMTMVTRAKIVLAVDQGEADVVEVADEGVVKAIGIRFVRIQIAMVHTPIDPIRTHNLTTSMVSQAPIRPKLLTEVAEEAGTVRTRAESVKSWPIFQLGTTPLRA